VTPRAHVVTVRRTARFVTLGPEHGATDAWIVCHGYGQLAADFIVPFQAVADGSRLIVAPEGLSRFYGDGGGKVGASWMTREFREADIDDYIAFLDEVTGALADALGDVGTVTLLGFSQGVATACRWAARGRLPARRVILWGALQPPDLCEEDYAALRARSTAWEYVVGEGDPYLSVEKMAAAAERARGHGLATGTRTFPGDHRLESATLRELAGE
jgi:predicted esterase